MADAFVSYSRADQALVSRLIRRLKDTGRSVWIDLEEIRPTVEWLAEIFSAIDGANFFLFVLTSDSARSQFCELELERAVKYGKRLIPILYRPVIPSEVPKALQPIQWIVFTEDEERAFAEMIEALETDPQWVKGHTRYLRRALEWESKRRRSSLSLRGRDLTEAEAWLAAAPDTPNPTITAPFRIHPGKSGRGQETNDPRLAGVSGTVLGGLIGTVWYLGSIPLSQAEALCRPGESSDRAQGLARLKRAGWVRSDPKVRTQYLRCLDLGEVRLGPNLPPEPDFCGSPSPI
jgi:hypothetical protein